MNPFRILLALSTSRYSERLISKSIDEAQLQVQAGRTVQLDVLYIIEDDELNRISNQVGQDGFLGASVQKDVLEALGAAHHRTALAHISSVRKQAETAGIDVQVTEAHGHFSKAVIEYAEQRHCDVILLVRDDRPFISRLLFGSEADKIARLAKRDGLGRVVIEEQD